MVEGEEKKPKTPAQLKKDAAKAEKLTKFTEKQRKMAEQKALQATKPPEVAILSLFYPFLPLISHHSQNFIVQITIKSVLTHILSLI